ncbi:MAG: histidine phosphatase family protein [Oceanospirillaceae bacterium]|nr:histidine phosphatase family protein [Oceanospirillaceae bacterium]
MALSYYESEEELKLWRDVVRPGHILLIEHAEAAITEDPAKLDAQACYKFLNLTDSGKTQAKRYYNTLHRHDLQDAMVYSSQWCRAIETATRLGLGVAHELPMLNAPTSENPAIIKLQTDTLAKWLKRQSLKHPHVLVTHKEVIQQLTGVVPAKDEAIVLYRDKRRRLTIKGHLPLIHVIK